MRIISGTLSGRQFASPRGHRTHPMSDKMRGALFNSLGDIEGLTVLDAFAGSGAIAFEAISRGAKRATAIERDRNAQRTIIENIEELDLGQQVTSIKAAASSWLRTSQQKFDIVIVDPPWDDMQLGLVERISERTKPGGIFVASLAKKARLIMGEDFELLSQKTYGDGTLRFYRRLD
jgi:16S rRNA (guanine966-N2)-methyltransferase